MAGMMFNAAVSVTPGAAPETLIQLETVTDGADVRILIHSIHIYAQGNTPAAAPDPFYLAVQTDCNEDSALTLNNMLASDAEDLDTFVKGWDAHAVEPTTTTKIWSGAVHEQGSLVVTFAPQHRIVIPGGTRMGLICNMPGADYYAVDATLVCEA